MWRVESRLLACTFQSHKQHLSKLYNFVVIYVCIVVLWFYNRISPLYFPLQLPVGRLYFVTVVYWIYHLWGLAVGDQPNRNQRIPFRQSHPSSAVYSSNFVFSQLGEWSPYKRSNPWVYFFAKSRYKGKSIAGPSLDLVDRKVWVFSCCIVCYIFTQFYVFPLLILYLVYISEIK